MKAITPFQLMARYLITAVCIFILGSNLSAQNISGGFSLGFNANQIDGDGVGGFKDFGYNVGGYAFFDFGNRLYLQPEILFSLKGAREVKFNYNRDLHYIDIPVLLRFRFYGTEEKGISVEAGPAASIMLMAKGGLAPLKFDETDQYRRVSMDITGGGTIGLTDRLDLFVRYSRSIINTIPLNIRPFLFNNIVTIGLRYGGG